MDDYFCFSRVVSQLDRVVYGIRFWGLMFEQVLHRTLLRFGIPQNLGVHCIAADIMNTFQMMKYVGRVMAHDNDTLAAIILVNANHIVL